MSPCTFDDALPRALVVVQSAFPNIDLAGCRVIRDMNGRLHVVVADGIEDPSLADARATLAAALGPYSPGLETGLERVSDTLSGPELLDEPFVVVDIDGTLVRVLERRVVGQDWTVAPGADARVLPLQPPPTHPPRVSFFSLKGGVGRSTALFLWGRELVAQGKRVLLLDLDLEAPGLGAQLLPEADRPEFGVVDWLVEDLVGNPVAEDWVIKRALVTPSPLADSGYLYVAPATGTRSMRDPGGFIGKLARAYLESGKGMGEGFSARIRRLLAGLEKTLEPDVVLIDARAGLHETAAAAVLHLDADVLLFATDQPTVWEGYRYLLAQLAQMAHFAPNRGDDDWRLRLKMVYAKAPKTQAALDGFRSRSYRLWLDCLYDEQPPGSAADDLFSFAETDDAAPHDPLLILQNPIFEQFNPLEDLNEAAEGAIAGSFGFFMKALNERVLTDSETSDPDSAE